MAYDVSSLYSSASSMENLVQQYMSLEQAPRDRIYEEQNRLDNRRNVLSSLDSTLSTLKTKADRLTDSISDYFATKLATSSDSDILGATATDAAQSGNHAMTVERLATADTRVSKQYTDSASSFATFTTDQTFSFEIGHPTDADDYNRATISITISATTFAKTDDEVLADIATAITDAMDAEVASENIESDEKIYASVVTEESGKSRLILKSGQSGYNYRMTFSDSADSLLSTLEVSAASQSSSTAGGYITTVGTSSSTSELNAKFEMDGLTFYRDSNNVTDAVDGLTLELKNTFSTEETVTITTDTESVINEVQGFLDAYNDSLEFLQESATTDSTTYERGVLADDLIYRSMINGFRNIMSGEIDSATSNTYTRLYHIGIEIDNNGSLSIADTEKFTEALETSASNIKEIFNSSSGVATSIEDYIDDYVKTGGTIDRSKENIDLSLTNLNDRLIRVEYTLQKREAQLRDQFASLQEAMSLLASQQSFASNLASFF